MRHDKSPDDPDSGGNLNFYAHAEYKAVILHSEGCSLSESSSTYQGTQV
jgi:hypothetical protein